MKRILPTILILLVMVLLGAMHWVDLSYNTSLATGFLLQGSVWARYAVLLLPLCMALLGLRTVGPRAISVLRVRHRALAGLFSVAALAGAVCGVATVVSSLLHFSVFRLLMGVLFVWYGVWMFLVALQLFVQSAPTPTKSALPGVLAALPFCVLTIYRVMIKPASLYRIEPLIACFAALLAMLWLAMLLRALYVALPQQRVRGMYFLGVFTFLFTTCLELPTTVYNTLFRLGEPLALLESINMGLLGLCAGCVSVAIAAQSDAPEDAAKLQPSKELP